MVPLSESNCDTQRQLTGATVGGKTYSYEYNSSGIRTRKTNYDGGYTEYYVVNGLPVAEQRFRANGTKQYILRYLYDESNSPVGFGIYYPTASSPYWQYYYFGKNLQGDVIALYRSDYNSTSKSYTPTLIATYSYDPWGAPTGIYDANGSTISQTAYHVAAYNPFRYRGYRYDGDTRLYYLQSRYYDPAIGRFINADGYASTGQGLIGHNMFTYCLNKPIKCKDANGDIAVEAVVVAALIGGVGGMATAAITGESLLVGFTVGAGTGAVSMFTGILGSAVVALVGDVVAQRMVNPSCKIEWSSALGAACGGYVSGCLGALGDAITDVACCGELGDAIVGADINVLDWIFGTGITVCTQDLFSPQPEYNPANAAWTLAPQINNRYPTKTSQCRKRGPIKSTRRARYSSSRTSYNVALF